MSRGRLNRPVRRDLAYAASFAPRGTVRFSMLHHAGPGPQLPLLARRGAVASTSAGTGPAEGPIPRSSKPAVSAQLQEVPGSPSHRQRCPPCCDGASRALPGDHEELRPVATDLPRAAIRATDGGIRQGVPGSRRCRTRSSGITGSNCRMLRRARSVLCAPAPRERGATMLRCSTGVDLERSGLSGGRWRRALAFGLRNPPVGFHRALQRRHGDRGRRRNTHPPRPG